MDGRRILRLLVQVGLLVGAVGCTKTTLNDPALAKPDLSAIRPGDTKSFWGGSKTPASSVDSNLVSSAPKKPDKSPPKPDTYVAIANSHLGAAFFNPPPPNRDQLIDKAREYYQIALKLDPKNAGALLGCGRLCARLGEREQADAWFQRYFQAHPKDHEAVYELACAHARLKDSVGAVAWCEVALKMDPENRTYRKTLGFVLAQSGRMQEGFDSLCRVMSEAEARFEMAKFLADRNMGEASKQQLLIAVQVDPNFAPAREWLAGF